MSDFDFDFEDKPKPRRRPNRREDYDDNRPRTPRILHKKSFPLIIAGGLVALFVAVYLVNELMIPDFVSADHIVNGKTYRGHGVVTGINRGIDVNEIVIHLTQSHGIMVAWNLDDGPSPKEGDRINFKLVARVPDPGLVEELNRNAPKNPNIPRPDPWKPHRLVSWSHR